MRRRDEMSQYELTPGRTVVELRPDTELERKLRQFIGNEGRAPAGPCRVISPDLLQEALNEIRRLRAKLLDHGIDE